MYEALLIMALTVVATISMVIGIGELMESKKSKDMSMETMPSMAEQSGTGMSESEAPIVEGEPGTGISEIDLVYNDRMSRIEGSKIKGIRKEGNNLILEMMDEVPAAPTENEEKMVDAIKNDDSADMPENSMENKPVMEDTPAMEPHVESADNENKEVNLMDKIKKMTKMD